MLIDHKMIFILEPGPPSQLRFPTITPSVVVVNWGPPEMTGGNITKYRVSYRLRDDTSPPIVRPSLVGTKYTDTVIDLSRERYYIFEVAAFTVGGGWGEKAVGKIFTTQGGNIDGRINIFCFPGFHIDELKISIL